MSSWTHGAQANEMAHFSTTLLCRLCHSFALHFLKSGG